jgi:hypothetical protein
VHPGTSIPANRVDALKSLPSKSDQTVKDALQKLNTRYTDDSGSLQSDLSASIDVPSTFNADDKSSRFRIDGDRSFKLAIGFLIQPGKKEYAEKALEIINQWSGKCRQFTGGNAALEAGWGLVGMARATELLRSKFPGYKSKFNEAGFKNFYKTVLKPWLVDYYEKEQSWISHGNWGSTIVQARLQYAIFADDSSEFSKLEEEAKQVFSNILETKNFQMVKPENRPTGPVERGHSHETRRDLAHAAFGIGGLIDIAEMLHNQGSTLDLYAYKNNLLLAAVEYQARCVVGDYPNDIKSWVEAKNDQQLRDWYFTDWYPYQMNWDMVYHHYTKRKGINMPRTEKVLTQPLSSPRDANRRRRPAKARGELFLHGLGLTTITHYGMSNSEDRN